MISGNYIKIISIYLCSTLLMYFNTPLFAAMPKSWYRIDDEYTEKSRAPFDWERPSKKFSEELNDLFEAQGDSFEAFLQESSYAQGKLHNAWELSVIRSQLALSAEGVLGILALKGTVAAELRWFKKSYLKKFDSNYDSVPDDQVHATFNPDMSEEEINRILVAIVDKAVQTGRISNRDLMLEGLKDKVNKTKRMLFRVPDTSFFPFSLFIFRIELIFNASGRVLPFMTAGGNLRIRLDWQLANSIKTKSEKKKSQIRDISSESFEQLVTGFCQDMGVLVKREPFGSKFRVKGFQIRIGQTTGGRVGVARASGSIAGMLFFKKNRSRRNSKEYQTNQSARNNTFNLIRPQTHQLPENSFILSDNYMKKVNNRKSNIISINRKKFRQGLQKAEKIGSYLMEQASRIKYRNWDLREIRTDYQLSLAGSLGVATIGGFGELRIEYTKI